MDSPLGSPLSDSSDDCWRVTRVGIRGNPLEAVAALDALKNVDGVADVSFSLSCATILGNPDEGALLGAVR